MIDSSTVSVTTSWKMSDISRVEPRRQFDAVLDGRAFYLTDFANNFFRDFRRLRQLALISFLKSIAAAPFSLSTISTMDLSLTAAKLFDIQGRNALVTGGTSGIGLMMAKGLIANGVGTLYITGNEPPEVFDQRIRVLHSFAQETGSNCVIYGFVPHLRSSLSTR